MLALLPCEQQPAHRKDLQHGRDQLDVDHLTVVHGVLSVCRRDIQVDGWDRWPDFSVDRVGGGGLEIGMIGMG
jgi:hypothetical protein